MDLGLRGRNAVVLGGTRGIGRAIAGTLAGEGAGVADCARNVDQVMNAVAELQTLGVQAKQKSFARSSIFEFDPKETSRIPSLDDHKCYSFAIKCGRRRGQGGPCETEKQGRI